MAAARKGTRFPICRVVERPKLTSETYHQQFHHCGPVLMLDKILVSQKSAKIAKHLMQNPNEDLSRLLRDIPADEESLELLARFCHGFEISLSIENVVRVACLAKYLDMTETHCRDNLLNKAIQFFEHNVMDSWSNSIKALKSANKTVFRQADELGLVNCCFETLILKALQNPSLLGDPMIMNEDDCDYDEDEGDEKHFNKPKPNTRRKLFDSSDWKDQEQEDLISLPLRLYAPIIHSMMQRQVPLKNVTANVCKYAESLLFCNDLKQGNDTHRKEIIEALVMLLPHHTAGLIHCAFLCKMLRFAITVDASLECRNGLEMRIGMQLVEASINDLLIPCQGYANDDAYDTDCLRRILKHFYSNYTGSDPTALTVVAELLEEFLAEIAADIDLKTTTFIAIADMSMAASDASDQRSCDGMYKAVDVYLDKHRHLIDSEKEDLCKLLDFRKLSDEALQHAAFNERLPVRVVMQVLFYSQLKIRESIPVAVPKALTQGEEDDGRSESMKMEMEKMENKVSELERKCIVMRREIERGGKREKKGSMWKEMKRKFGCMTSMHDSDCHENKKMMKKKVHPRLL